MRQTFRQKDIKELWNQNIEIKKEYKIYEFEISLSSGGYVRNFGNLLGGICFDIERLEYID